MGMPKQMVSPRRRVFRYVVRLRAGYRKRLASAKLWGALQRVRFHNLWFRTWTWGKGRIGHAATIAVLACLLTVALVHNEIEQLAAPWVTDTRVTSLQNALLNVGSQLIGVSALVFGLVTFALQANLERMPFTLFERLTSDKQLLLFFAGTFAISIVVVILSLFLDKSNAGTVTLLGIWALLAVLTLIFLSFRRALLLVNPAHQLANIVSNVQRSFKLWEKGLRLYRPLMGRGMPTGPHDTERLAFFSLHSRWTGDAKKGIQHTTAYVRHYANVGDFEVSGAAVNALVSINQLYVQIKGKTFFNNDVFFDAGMSTDDVVNTTLEQLRQLAEHGIQTNNETLAEQAMTGMAALVRVYASIDYATSFNFKTHASLAAGYLDGAVQSAVPKNLPDVVMQGVRLLGASGHVFIAAKTGTEVASIAGHLCKFGAIGAVADKYRPVTQTAMTQLADLTVSLLRSKVDEVGFAGNALLDSAKTISSMFIRVPDAQPMSIHETYLGPFLSTKLPSTLTNLANAVIGSDADNADAKQIIENVEEWADDLHRFYKDLFVEAISAKSLVTVSITHSITQMTRVLLGFAAASAASEHDRDELVDHATHLVYALSWVADTQESVRFAERCAFTNSVTDLAVDVANSDHEKVRQALLEILVGWLVKSAKHDAQLRSAEKCVAAIAASLVLRGQDHVPADVITLIRRRVGTAQGLSREQLENVCRRVSEEYIDRNQDQFSIDRLEYVINRLDRVRFETLVRELLPVLLPPAPTSAAPV